MIPSHKVRHHYFRSFHWNIPPYDYFCIWSYQCNTLTLQLISLIQPELIKRMQNWLCHSFRTTLGRSLGKFNGFHDFCLDYHRLSYLILLLFSMCWFFTTNIHWKQEHTDHIVKFIIQALLQSPYHKSLQVCIKHGGSQLEAYKSSVHA